MQSEGTISLREARVTSSRTLGTLASLTVVLVVVVCAAALVGSAHISLSEIGSMLIHGRQSVAPEQAVILLDLRLPRIALALVVGGGLAVAGASYQALLRNPLAEPYVLGVSGGAALGAIFAIIFLPSLVFSRPLLAFAGALATTFIVYSLGRGKAGSGTDRLILAGVIVTSFLSAGIVFLTTLATGQQLRGITFWLLGDLSLGGGTLLPVLTAIVLLSIAGIFIFARSLNLMMVSETDAADLGVEVGRVKFVVFTLASLITGVVVAIGGSVGYVGLIVPHIIRLAFGSDYRLLIPASMLGGASIVLLADTVARTAMSPRELPVGAVTALIGAPLFLYLLVKGR